MSVDVTGEDPGGERSLASRFAPAETAGMGDGETSLAGTEPFLLTDRMRVYPDGEAPPSPEDVGSRETVAGSDRERHGIQAPVDREALRSMVADLVRDELRGRTGERLTDSIRRFVGREIQRALATRDPR